MERDYIIEYLTESAETKYRDFIIKLIPTIDVSNVLGVRMPILKELSKNILKSDYISFLEDKNFEIYEERVLYGLVLGGLKDYSIMERYLKIFVNHIDNWAVCDSLCSALKIVKKNRETILPYIIECAESSDTYTERFGVVMLMNYYNDEEHIDLLFSLFNKSTSEEYYVRMAIAWAVSMCFVKCYDATLKFLNNNQLDDWTHNKSIQKIIESNRVSSEDKKYVRTLKRNNASK